MTVMGMALNDWPHPVTKYEGGKQIWKCKIYTIWTNMLIRCETVPGQERQPTYRDVDVCEEWFSFSKFREWAAPRYKDGYELDKDLLHPGSKLYSPETCRFIRFEVNRTLHMKEPTGNLPTGVAKKRERFTARICNGSGVREFLGSRLTPMEAHKLWQARKIEVLEEFIASEPDIVVAGALQKIVDKVRQDMHNGVETKSFKEI
jgi:hypothetical protein